MDTVGGGGKPWLKPKALICYICGREFGTASLSIHQKNCARLWEDREKLKPKRERRPVPEAPKEIAVATVGSNGIDQFNDVAFNAFTSKSMVQCPNCARKFLEDRLVVHLRSCTSENPCKPVRPITPVKEEPVRSQANPIPITSQSMNFKPSRVVSSNSASFQGIPAKQSILDKYMSDSKLKTQEINEIPEVKNTEIARIASKEAEIEESEIKNIAETLRMSTMKSKEISQILRPKSIQGNLEETKVGVKVANTSPSYEFQPEEDSRVPCSKCGRKFNPDRIAKHEEICKEDNEAEYKKPKEEAKVYSKSPEPARPITPKPKKGEETVECPYCTRNFDPKVAERHIPKCKDIVNRPSPPQKTKSASQSVIINKPALLGNSNSPAKNSEFRQTERPFRDSTEKVFCHNCGERYYPNSKFCSFCGEKK